MGDLAIDERIILTCLTKKYVGGYTRHLVYSRFHQQSIVNTIMNRGFCTRRQFLN
jgi:hypothetical protein